MSSFSDRSGMIMVTVAEGLQSAVDPQSVVSGIRRRDHHILAALLSIAHSLDRIATKLERASE